MNCNCVEQLKESVKEKLLKNEEVLEAETKINCEEEQYFTSGTTNLALRFNLAFRKIKVNGEPYTRLTRDGMSVQCIYCPICGKPLNGLKGSDE